MNKLLLSLAAVTLISVPSAYAAPNEQLDALRAEISSFKNTLHEHSQKLAAIAETLDQEDMTYLNKLPLKDYPDVSALEAIAELDEMMQIMEIGFTSVEQTIPEKK